MQNIRIIGLLGKKHKDYRIIQTPLWGPPCEYNVWKLKPCSSNRREMRDEWYFLVGRPSYHIGSWSLCLTKTFWTQMKKTTFSNQWTIQYGPSSIHLFEIVLTKAISSSKQWVYCEQHIEIFMCETCILYLSLSMISMKWSKVWMTDSNSK